MFNRRTLLVAGTSAGLATVLYGCGQTDDTPEASAQTVSGDAGADAGDVALYDGSTIEPINNEAINNPDGFADRPLGGVDADVTLIEYVSPTCPHCANFHQTVYPDLKEAYIDTGRIRFIARPFRRNVLDLAVFMVAEASGTAYHDVLSAYMAQQNDWMSADNPREAIFEIAQEFGFTQERFEEVLTDDAMFDALESMREQALDEFGLVGTPTFYINGQRLEGNATFETLSEEIDSRL
ncbi:thioredoxin domain-containing protein [Pelagibacterium montanilacus]|uniref:thioredoxin domain-containing protein n=1 Tax=Pelagibacterium montanilacus TaxID=2185280 RepID=UPI0013DE8BE0|nr:thioredoxin domain-containing protein [Pelagibacterium montanilacus]